jgi:hypothetical protein
MFCTITSFPSKCGSLPAGLAVPQPLPGEVYRRMLAQHIAGMARDHSISE